MNKHFFSTLVLVAALSDVANATPLGIVTPNTNLGWSSTNESGQQVTWNTRVVSGQTVVVRIIGNTETVFSAPTGVTLTNSVIRPSENGTYGGVIGVCSGGVNCGVVFSGNNSATVISQGGTDITPTQLFENQTWVGTPNDSSAAVRGTFASGTPTGSSATPSPGYVITTGAAVRTSSGIVVTGAATSDGITGRAFISKDDMFSLMPTVSGDAAAFAISPNAQLLGGSDGNLASKWTPETGEESFFPLFGGAFQEGLTFSILDGGSASGSDANNLGWVYSPYFGVSKTTCQFLAAVEAPLPSACSGAGIGRTVLSQYVDLVTSQIVISLAGQGSVIDFTGIDPIYFHPIGWDQADADNSAATPEPNSMTMLVIGSMLAMFSHWVKNRAQTPNYLKSFLAARSGR